MGETTNFPQKTCVCNLVQETSFCKLWGLTSKNVDEWVWQTSIGIVVEKKSPGISEQPLNWDEKQGFLGLQLYIYHI